MPVQFIIYIVAALSCFSAGYYSAWDHEHKEVITLQASIELSNKIAAQKLSEITANVEIETIKQRETITHLEANHEQAQKDNSSLANQLAAAQLQYRTANKPSRGCPLPKVSYAKPSENNVGTGQIVQTSDLSARLDKFISDKAVTCDQIDLDKHFLLQWISSLPSDLVE